MKITYRPHCGGYIESMNQIKIYENIMDALRSIVKDHDGAFALEDLCISYYGFDARNEWNTFLISTKRLGNTVYSTPAPIGWCKFE